MLVLRVEGVGVAVGTTHVFTDPVYVVKNDVRGGSVETETSA